MANLASAAPFIASMLERASIPYGIIEGLLAVRLIGGDRTTKDVFQASMRRMWEVIRGRRVMGYGSRLKIPNSRLISNIMKVFVKTGPGFDNCARSFEVEPRDLAENFMLHTVPSSSGPLQIRGEVRGFVDLLESLDVDTFLERMPRQSQAYWKLFFGR
ncbi:hypothetical protein BDV06DRAFT_213237 [Aspergillus oleicola]